MTSYAPPYALRRMTVTFGTDASAKAKRSLRAVLDNPSVLLVGPRQGKPGTSTNVTRGDVEATRAEANETRAAFIDASMSSTPASTCG